jgi:SAM-dependent methyltransferase
VRKRTTANFVPALGRRWLTSLYDPVLRWTMREGTFKRALIAQAGIAPGNRVLDLGCGTGTLTVLIKRSVARADVVGVDVDPTMLQIARAKVARHGLDVRLDEARTSTLPYPDASFDQVVSSLVFHHLGAEEKRQTAAEILRVLRPGGSLHVADWGKPPNVLLRAGFLVVQMLDGFATTAENACGMLPNVFTRAGFVDVAVRQRFSTAFGSLWLIRARRGADTHGTFMSASGARSKITRR